MLLMSWYFGKHRCGLAWLHQITKAYLEGVCYFFGYIHFQMCVGSAIVSTTTHAHMEITYIILGETA